MITNCCANEEMPEKQMETQKGEGEAGKELAKSTMQKTTVRRQYWEQLRAGSSMSPKPLSDTNATCNIKSNALYVKSH